MMQERQILIVEDDELNRNMLSEILSGEYKVLEAENGQEALKILNRCKDSIALILLDVMMPVMDGYSFLDSMKKDSALALIPVIVMTQGGSEDDEVSALSHGATDFVSKPYRPRVIMHRVANLIKLRENASLVNQFRIDRLTGIYSKEFFYQKVRERLDENPEKEYTIVCSNMENFKLYNDTFGREAGDCLLQDIATSMRVRIGETGICGRYGADRFLLLQEREQEAEDRERFIQRIQTERPKIIRNVSVKWGIYQIVNRSMPVEQMCDRALLAVDSIKGQYNQQIAVYDDALRSKLLQEKAITDAMETALEEGQFAVYYQPKYSLKDKCMAGAEALVRWIHPERGFLSPGEFIPLFEKNGFIPRLDQYVWRQVCVQLRDWQEKGYPPMAVSVNVSRADVYQPHLADTLMDITKEYGVDPAFLHLEITESAYTESPEQIINTVEELRERGFIIEMDDFGSGYSSLNMLSQMKLDVLKLDMKFIQNEMIKPETQSILNDIISMAHRMHLSVVAEGVETEEQMMRLNAVGCDYVQGYFIAKPMPASEFEELIASVETPVGTINGQFDIENDRICQQSIDILNSLVVDLMLAGIIDISRSSITILKDSTGERDLRGEHPYSEFFYNRMQSTIMAESAEALRLADLSYLVEKLENKEKISYDFHMKDGTWQRCIWQPFQNYEIDGQRILLYSSNVTGEYKGNERVSDVLENQETIIQGLGDVYFSVLLVDYLHDRVSVFRHEDEVGREIADHIEKCSYCWSVAVEQYCGEQVSEESSDVLRRTLSLEHLRKNREGFSVSYRKKAKNGSRYLEARVSFVEKNDGSRVAVVGTRSVDDAVNYEKTLRTRMQMIAAALGTMYPLVAEVNITKNSYQIATYSEFINKTAATSGTLDDFITVGKSTLPDKEEAEAFYKLFCRQNQIDAFRRGEKELLLRHRQMGDDGFIHWMETRVIFVAGEDGDMHEISLSRPIDKEIRLKENLEMAKEAAEAANRAKSAFLFNISHDVRTPMNAIIGFADLADRYIHNPEKLKGYLKKIRISGDYMLKLLNSVLEMARIEKGRMALDYEPAELTEVCQNALAMFEEEAESRHLCYQYDIAFDQITANIDRVRVEEILSNIVSNAIKYTGEGGSVNVSVSLEEKTNNKYVMTAVVKDNGIGMSKEFLPSIFSSFERERNQTTAEIQGTGLGMGITRSLLDIMGGDIRIESELGVGTAVTVSIPFERVTSPDVYKENVHAEDYFELFRNKRILLAEDNDLNAEIAAELFKQAGLLMDRAEDGVACVSMICRADPGYYDAIVMDIQMPNLNGYMATQRIRSLKDPQKSSIPIIAMTANAFEEDRKEALESGMDGFVSKPVDINKLFETLAEIIR